MTDVDLQAHAIAYAFAGHAVLPLHWPSDRGCSCGRRCASPAKHPLTGSGKDDATTDVHQIGAWWQKWPAANIGIRPAPGTVVVDVDPRHGGAQALVAVLAGHALPATWTANTGGGGLHAWYRVGGELRGELCAGVDLKAPGGYVVAPPSRHMSGRRYEWATELPIAAAPPWLAAAMRKPPPPPVRLARPAGAVGSSSAADDGLVRIVLDAAPGERNRRLHWAACRAAERGAPQQLLERLHEAAVGIGLHPTEVERTIRSALRSTGTVTAA